ncbi:hypothetical protein KIN20_009347 [Parelaphostrongylus tenuis]|uniref:Uncharacterized protein n=1 Tax=Parelaphostrongylus tenuis TaxID=148309 RepID=A0AAD5MAZ6_PARTN|nr:hypothetical protein KIN20_009347 [Parelaphostrongylus tenuis]
MDGQETSTGVNFTMETRTIDRKRIKAQIWDSGGQLLGNHSILFSANILFFLRSMTSLSSDPSTIDKGAILALESALALLCGPATEPIFAGFRIILTFCRTPQSDREMVGSCRVK